MNNETKPTAVIHFSHRRNQWGDELIVTAAVDTCVVYSQRQPVASEFEVLNWLVEAVHQIWKHQRGGMILYIADATMRSLLTGSRSHPGLEVRSVVTGAAMQATWEVAISAHSLELYGPAEKPVPEIKARRVYATDASKRKRDSLIGISAVGSTGTVAVGHVRASTVAEGEFAAIRMVLSRLKRSTTAREVDIITDSLIAARVINAGCARPGAGNFERTCLAELDKVRARGIEVRVSWVRGHSGNPLNALADRAAVIARRCGQWGQPQEELIGNIRVELRALIDASDLHQFVPATPLPTATGCNGRVAAAQAAS